MRDDVLISLVDMVSEHCYTENPDNVNGNGLWTNTNAIHVLSEIGLLGEVTGFQRGCSASWTDLGKKVLKMAHERRGAEVWEDES